MEPRDFCYWLNGFFELSDDSAGLTHKQAQTIKNHLHLVFAHAIDPTITKDKGKKKILQEIHNGDKKKSKTDSRDMRIMC